MGQLTHDAESFPLIPTLLLTGTAQTHLFSINMGKPRRKTLHLATEHFRSATIISDMLLQPLTYSFNAPESFIVNDPFLII